ncbi:MAG: hypothetical protein E7Z66_03730 [Thermoplasmata archaeon]|nr:hypothetical protein [Thermoplasmata archaeon]
MKNIPVIVTSVFIIFVLCGGIVTNYYSSGQTDVSASISDGQLTIEVDSNVPDTFMYAVYADAVARDSVYFYYDEDYQSFTSHILQKSAFEAMETTLVNRGVNDISYLDSDTIVSVMDNSDVNIVFLSGSLPETIFDKNSGSLFEVWLSNGGTVFWLGPEIGSFRSTQDNLIETDVTFLNCNYVHNGDIEKTGDICSEDSLALSVFYEFSTYGLSNNYPGSKVLGRLSPDGYSSISVVGNVLGEGRIYVFGGVLDYVSIKLITSMSDVIASGVTEESRLIGYGKFNKMYGSTSIDVELMVEEGDTVYIMKSAPMSSSGYRIVL